MDHGVSGDSSTSERDARDSEECDLWEIAILEMLVARNVLYSDNPETVQLSTNGKIAQHFESA